MVEFKWTWVRFEMMIDIFKTPNTKKNERPMSLTGLAKKIEAKREDPIYINVLSYLLDMGGIIHTDTEGSSKIIRINHKELRKIIESSEIYGCVKDYIKYKTDFYIGV